MTLFQVVESAFEIDGRRITLETGRLARQAHGAVLVRQGRAAVLVTAVLGGEANGRDGDGADFVPLTVEYREKLAAAGRIPGSFQRREGRISDDEILVSRILDRSTRPLFAKGIGREIQVQATLLSADFPRIEASLLALIGASAALAISPIPWNGPIAGTRLARCDGEWHAFPDPAQRARADVDLVLAVSGRGLVMVEGGANRVADEEVLEGLLLAQERLAPALAAIEELRSKAGRPKLELAPKTDSPERAALRAKVESIGAALLAPVVEIAGKAARRDALVRARDEIVRAAAPDAAQTPAVLQLVHALADRLVRERVLAGAKRLDGRGPEEIRPIECSVDWLAGPHGCALFTRGETQAMCTCTLAQRDAAQEVETLGGMESRTFLLHYNFPPYSVGEVRALRGPGRREIGHGNLARRALVPVLPSFQAFPYVIRIESDISESNGSSSMATTCGGCLALMDAGVPITEPVAGIAMGLVSDGTRFQVLSDILGDEDHLGDMDFKVTGTAEGITAVQMDNKLGSLPSEVLGRALEQAARGRRHILEQMKRALARPRASLKEHAPRVTAVRIATPAIPDLIGPRGANLKSLRQSLGVEVTIDDAGFAYVYAADAGRAREAVRRIRQKAGVVESGRLYKGRVSGVKEFGAFIRIFDSAEGLVHVSDWDERFTANLAAVAREGDEVVVRVLGIDERGKLRLSRKEALNARGEEIIAA